MATILEQYRKRRDDYASQIASNSFPLGDLMALQEMNYRICVLETFQSFANTIPVTMDKQVIADHYKVVSCYLDLLLKERKFGPKKDDMQRQRRDTALAALEDVVRDRKGIFAHFPLRSPDSYKECVISLCNTVLPMWMQYRDTYIRL